MSGQEQDSELTSLETFLTEAYHRGPNLPRDEAEDEADGEVEQGDPSSPPSALQNQTVISSNKVSLGSRLILQPCVFEETRAAEF
jgi:hypothetical protein